MRIVLSHVLRPDFLEIHLLFVSICTKFLNIKFITKYYLTKKNFGIFFSKIELQRQWSCVMCTWQGLFNARGKNFALPPPLTGRNIHSGSKGGVKNHKFKFCLILSYFPYFSNWNCLKRIFFQSEHNSLTLSKFLKVLFWYLCLIYTPPIWNFTTVDSAAAVACCHVHCHHIVRKMEKKKMAKKKRHLAPTRKFARHIHNNRYDY